MDTWETHFKTLLNPHNKRKAYETKTKENRTEQAPITPEEAKGVIAKMKNKKASSPDHIFIEHIKQTAEVLIKT